MSVALPPLVEPGPPLSREETHRYARHLLVPAVGEAGQRRLRNAHVAVLGAGGLGSPALLYLAAAGIGAVTIIDDDMVDVTNLQRQVIHPDASVGRPKVDTAREAVAALNPGVAITTHRTRLTLDNAAELFAGADLVLDGTDNFDTRYAVNDACARLGLPYVWASVYRTQAQVSVFWNAPPSPWAGTDLRDLFPRPPAPGTVPSCGDAGVLGALTGQVGSMMAAEAVKLICGVGSPLLGRIAFVDLLDASVTAIPLRPRDRSADTAAPEPTKEQPVFTLITPTDLAAELDGESPPTVLDVREPAEVAIAAIDGSVRIPLGEVLSGAPDLPRDADLVVHCKVQPRAEAAAASLEAAGFTRVRVLAGGILSWIDDVEPEKARY
ncbi:adenylyltransferase/sulfurtransferase MoeZ [Propioniciclava coleopterorum]|uniref:Adenylyltransferase/sulfurtransferase MoeZ n=1 Tax=Propioniciclava coleopterorum TaxID=2714937 RepID=A0A6G7Y7T9_9ACTN|nr:ThiF family adenylyltransferase [Propioniciclava coleopterorum]QIK72882.1 adenylyltransferase/sulfurtransferase MoeZ [Propioniciclava coleopterorum]